MKSELRIHPVVMVALFALAFVSMISFAGYWYARLDHLSHLAEEETALRGELEQLDTWGKWTLEYVKIDRGIDYLSKNRLTGETKRQLTEQIWQISRSYSLDPLLILAVVAQESHGNPNARGRTRSGKESGAMGLMQIKLETARKMAYHFGLSVETQEDLLKPEINVAAIARRNDFTLFEFFQSDVAGHSMDYARACAVLRTYDRFLASLVRFAEAMGVTIVLTSDHGNVENMSERGHTLNPVPFVAFGPKEEFLRERVSSLVDVTPAILSAFDT